MNYGVDERNGRFLLRALLWGLILCEGASTAVSYLPIPSPFNPYLLLAFAPLLASAVVFWALYRGSVPGLVLFFIGTVFGSIVEVTDDFFYGGTAALSSPSSLLGLGAMLLRLTVILCVFRSDTVGRYLDLRRRYRRRRDLILEIVLFAVVLLPQLPTLLLSLYAFLLL